MADMQLAGRAHAAEDAFLRHLVKVNSTVSVVLVLSCFGHGNLLTNKIGNVRAFFGMFERYTHPMAVLIQIDHRVLIEIFRLDGFIIAENDIQCIRIMKVLCSHEYSFILPQNKKRLALDENPATKPRTPALHFNHRLLQRATLNHFGAGKEKALIHEEVGLPTLIANADKMLDKVELIGPLRFAVQRHASLFRRAIALAIIAIHARAHEIFPRIFAAAILRQHMIHGERTLRGAAILAAVAVALDNILARQNHALARNVNVCHQPHDAGKRQRGSHRAHFPARMTLDDFSFAQNDQNNRLLCGDHTHRLIVLIQNEHMSVQTTHIFTRRAFR